MLSILDKKRDRIGSSEEEPEVDEHEPNLLEGDVVSGAGLEVGELISKISRDRGVGLVDASRGLYRTLKDERVRLVDPSPPRSIFGFFSPVYSLWFWLVVDFVGFLIFSIYLMPQVYPLSILRVVAGAIFVLYVPGYALIEALYSRKNQLNRLERFGLSVGLSLALVTLVGLLLNYTPWGIRLDPALVALSLLTLVFAVVAVYRKYEYWRLACGV